MNRRSLREQVFKLLFRVEFNEKDEMEEQCRLFLEHEDVEMSEKDADYIVGKYTAIQEKLEEIDKNISEVIANEAKQMGYEIVITKKLVLYGGNDITEEIIKKVK